MTSHRLFRSPIRGAIRGAIRIPPLQVVHRLRELPRDCDIVAYCT
jgi:hypothetical protein